MPQENIRRALCRSAARLTILFFVLLAFISQGALAEGMASSERLSIVRNYGPDDGFSQNEVTTIVQGRDGYLWLGTFGGLVRFDGEKFVTLRAVRGSGTRKNAAVSTGPSSDRILKLRMDADGRIWIATQDAGLNVYINGRFQHLPICGGVCGVNAISQEVGGIIWATTSAGLFRVETDTFLATLITDRSGGLYADVAVGNDGHAYVSGGTRGMGKVVGKEIVPLSQPHGVINTFGVKELNGQLVVSTNQGLYLFDPTQSTWLPKLVEPGARLLASPNGHLWVSTKSGQLLQAEASGEWQSLGELPPVLVNDVWVDRDGVLWVGTVQRGLWSVRDSMAIRRTNTGDRRSYGEGGRAVVGDGRGGVWLGFACGGLLHRLRDGRYEEPRSSLVRRDECIVSMLRDKDGSLWLGTGHAGLVRTSGAKEETVLGSSGLQDLQIWRSESGNYWLASEDNTFNVYRTVHGSYALSQPVPALAGLRIRRMITARTGGVWFAGDFGVLRLEEGRVAELLTPAQGLSSRFARSIYEDNDGVLWVGTYGGGLNRVENGAITHFDEGNGLFDDTVSCILVDEAGHMWLGGNRGISVIMRTNRQRGRIEAIPFAVSSGSETFELNGGGQSTCYQDERGHLWFALVRGFAEVDPSRLVEIAAPRPEVNIERVTSASIKHDPLGVVVLDTSTQQLEIAYAAINLTSPDQLSYRYRVSSMSTEWIYAGSTKTIILQNVPWGDSLFEVQAKNRGGRWSKSAKVAVSRPEPWYQRQWLWPLVSFIALVTVVWRTRELRPYRRTGVHFGRDVRTRLRD